MKTAGNPAAIGSHIGPITTPRIRRTMTPITDKYSAKVLICQTASASM